MSKPQKGGKSDRRDGEDGEREWAKVTIQDPRLLLCLPSKGERVLRIYAVGVDVVI